MTCLAPSISCVMTQTASTHPSHTWQLRPATDPHRLGRLGHRRRQLGIRLGPAGRQGIHCRDPSRARPWHQLDRHRSGLRARPLGGSRGARAKIHRSQAASLHQVLDAWHPDRSSTGRSRPNRLTEELEGSCADWEWKRSTSTRSTGRIPKRDRSGMEPWRVKRAGQGPLHRRVELQRRTR